MYKNTPCLVRSPASKKRKTDTEYTGYEIKLELEEHDEDLVMTSRGEDGIIGTEVKQEQFEVDFEKGDLKEAGEVGGDLDLLFKIKQEMEE